MALCAKNDGAAEGARLIVPPKFEVGEIRVPTPTCEPHDGQPKMILCIKR